MKLRNLIYIAICVICVISIIVAIYVQIMPKTNQGDDINTTGPNISGSQTEDKKEEEKDQETIKKEFNDLFNNSINLNHYDTSGIEKLVADQDIIYSAYNMQKKEENKYELNIHVPVVNIKGEVAQGFNATTQNIFANKATEIINNAKANTIYSIDYMGYMNGDILSIVIRSTLKEGNSAQRVIIQTYNYNVKENKKVEIGKILEQEEIKVDALNKKINKVVAEANIEAEALKNSGYSVYTRDINNTMYKAENATNYFIGPNGSLYIIYAYGNQNFTSEMDIIVI